MTRLKRKNYKNVNKTVVVKKNLEDFKDFKEDQLGKPRNLG